MSLCYKKDKSQCLQSLISFSYIFSLLVLLFSLSFSFLKRRDFALINEVNQLKPTSFMTTVVRIFSWVWKFTVGISYSLKPCPIHAHYKLKYLFTTSFNNSYCLHRSATTSRLQSTKIEQSYRNQKLINKPKTFIKKKNFKKKPMTQWITGKTNIQGNQLQRALRKFEALQFYNKTAISIFLKPHCTN